MPPHQRFGNQTVVTASPRRKERRQKAAHAPCPAGRSCGPCPARSNQRPPPRMVRSIVASAEPKARFKLVCNRSPCAALSAASPSGRRTSVAITMPTTAPGMPTRSETAVRVLSALSGLWQLHCRKRKSRLLKSRHLQLTFSQPNFSRRFACQIKKAIIADIAAVRAGSAQ